jgi:putative transposase
LGNRQIVAYLSRSGLSARRYRVRRLMCFMVVQAIYKGPNTGRKHF